MKLDKREFIRWFKKGWVLIILSTLLTIITANLGFASWGAFLVSLSTNPLGGLSGLLALGLLSLVWGIVLYPIVTGWLIEEIDKRIRK